MNSYDAPNRLLALRANLQQEQGQFFTVGCSWLTPDVVQFLKRHAHLGVLDPFAGEGHLVHAVRSVLKCVSSGLDIDSSMYAHNDSLEYIPKAHCIVTNPPYLSKARASRLKLAGPRRYFTSCPKHDNLYKIGLERCLQAAKYVVAIVPESFLHSSFDMTNLVHATVLEDSPFADTEVPTCVCCFDTTRIQRPVVICRAFRVLLHDLPTAFPGRTDIVFNTYGQITLHAIDGCVGNRIEFLHHASDTGPAARSIISVNVPVAARYVSRLVDLANAELEALREAYHDLVLSPFMGNTNSGVRRRRLGIAQARYILTRALEKLESGH